MTGLVGLNGKSINEPEGLLSLPAALKALADSVDGKEAQVHPSLVIVISVSGDGDTNVMAGGPGATAVNVIEALLAASTNTFRQSIIEAQQEQAKQG